MNENIPEKLLKPYEPEATEDDIYKRWEESGFFNPDVCVKKGICDEKAEPFSIILPPPNVTGTLHMGHAAMLAVEDILVRYNRMQGKKTLWLPGTDHAAIATQSKVEKIIYKEEKKSYILIDSKGTTGLKIPVGFVRLNADNPLIRIFSEKNSFFMTLSVLTIASLCAQVTVESQ